jgi:hypothetical protein
LACRLGFRCRGGAREYFYSLRAEAIITEKRSALDAIAKLLQEKEVVSGEEIKSLI